MFTIIRDLIRYNIEFAIGLAILLLLIGAVILSFFSPYPAADIYVVPPDMPPDVPALKVFYLYLTAGCNLHCRHCWITPTFVQGKPVPAECLDLGRLKGAVAEGKPMGLSAAKLTGGGHNAFSRYERGEVMPMPSVLNLLKLLDRHPVLLAELDAFGEKENINFTITATLDPDQIGENIKKYC